MAMLMVRLMAGLTARMMAGRMAGLIAGLGWWLGWCAGGWAGPCYAASHLSEGGRAVARVFEVIRALKKTISQGAHTRPKHETIFGIRINTHTSVLRVCEDSLFTGPTLLC